MAPHFGNEPHPEKSLVFLLANLNKRGVTLDLDDPDGRELLRRMARTADRAERLLLLPDVLPLRLDDGGIVGVRGVAFAVHQAAIFTTACGSSRSPYA